MDSKGWKADGDGKNEGLTDGDDCTNRIRIGLGTPVYFFFQINSDKFVDDSQMVNLNEIACIAKDENLKVSISGVADSATGTRSRNQELVQRRANYIAKSLVERGMSMNTTYTCVHSR